MSDVMDKRLKYLNTLRSFECAARHQSYSKAANELFVSQAAVSQQIRQLENALSVKLFIRNGRSMQLTMAGEKLYQASHQAFATLIQGFNQIQNEGIAGSLTITSTQAFSALWILPRLYKFSQQHPEINVRVLGSNQIENLYENQIDVAIRFGEPQQLNANGQLYCKTFGEDIVYPVCSPALLSQVNLQTPKDLLQCCLVTLANETVITWQKWFDNVGVTGFERHTNKTEVISSDFALNAVLSGHGVALSASAFSSQYVKTGHLVVPFNLKHPQTLKRYIVFDENSAKIKRIQLFITWLEAEMITN